MNEHTQYPPGSQDAKTAAACLKVVRSLIHPGNPKSNLFAMCVICDVNGRTQFSVNAVNTLTREEVLKEIQNVFDRMREELNAEN